MVDMKTPSRFLENDLRSRKEKMMMAQGEMSTRDKYAPLFFSQIPMAFSAALLNVRPANMSAGTAQSEEQKNEEWVRCNTNAMPRGFDVSWSSRVARAKTGRRRRSLENGTPGSARPPARQNHVAPPAAPGPGPGLPA
jgi:hypothetical protein